MQLNQEAYFSSAHGMFPLREELKNNNSVARIHIDNKVKLDASGFAVFLETPGGAQLPCLCTNSHVIRTADVCPVYVEFVFSHLYNEPVRISLLPSLFFYGNPRLDIVFVALDPHQIQRCNLFPFDHNPPIANLLDIIRIVHHPTGREKHVSLACINGIETYRGEEAFCYKAESQKGSSGAPVTRNGRLIGIHLGAGKNSNYARPISSVFDYLPQKIQDKSDPNFGKIKVKLDEFQEFGIYEGHVDALGFPSGQGKWTSCKNPEDCWEGEWKFGLRHGSCIHQNYLKSRKYCVYELSWDFCTSFYMGVPIQMFLKAKGENDAIIKIWECSYFEVVNFDDTEKNRDLHLFFNDPERFWEIILQRVHSQSPHFWENTLCLGAVTTMTILAAWGLAKLKK